MEADEPSTPLPVDVRNADLGEHVGSSRVDRACGSHAQDRATPDGATATPGATQMVGAPNGSRRVRDLLGQIVATVCCGALFAVILQLTVQNYVVEGTSMLPNVQSGDRVLVDRLAYRMGSPKRGDIVVFRYPGSNMNLIKRIIGLPGDMVEIEPGMVRIDGRIIAEPYIRFVEQYTYGPQRVPAGEYFVLGDNRVVSYDSHVWGFLPSKYLYGRVIATYWPVGDFHLYGL